MLNTNPYPTPIDQAWLKFWTGLMREGGGVSRLERYLVPGLVREKPARPPDVSMQVLHIADVLDDIDDYFRWIKQLRKQDPDAYNLYKQVGGVILPWSKEAIAVCNKPDKRLPADPRKWPTFFMISMPSKVDTSDRICPKLIYFTKKAPGKTGRLYVPEGKLVAVYEGTMYLTGDLLPKSVFAEFLVGVNADGEAYGLRVKEVWTQATNGRYGEFISHKGFDYPLALKERSDVPPRQHAAELLYWVMNAAVSAFDGVQVMVSKDGVAGRFGIPLNKTTEFFRDRAFEATVGGSRRKIFHHVVGHTRMLASGYQTQVRSHYRGARRFEWNGTKVLLTVPDHHHFRVERLNIESEDSDAVLPGHMTTEHLGRDLRRRIEAPTKQEMRKKVDLRELGLL